MLYNLQSDARGSQPQGDSGVVLPRILQKAQNSQKYTLHENTMQYSSQGGL